MEFHPSSVRDRHSREAEEDSAPVQHDRSAHDFDPPAWRAFLEARRNIRLVRPGPRLIDLERRARFARLPDAG